KDTTIERVADYAFSNDGSTLVYVRTAAEKDSIGADAGLYYHDLATGQSRRISSGKGTYNHLTFDDASGQLAFTADKSPEKSLQKSFSLYYYTPGRDSAVIVASISSTGIPQGWNVSGNRDVRFSKNGEKLFFGVAPIPPVKDTTLVEFEHANVDIWHWKDDYLQPQQLVNAEREKKRS